MALSEAGQEVKSTAATTAPLAEAAGAQPRETATPTRLTEARSFSADTSIEATTATAEIAWQIDQLRLATKEEIEDLMKIARSGSTTRFLLEQFAEKRQLLQSEVQAAIDAKNLEAKKRRAREWKSNTTLMRSNANVLGKRTGLGLTMRDKYQRDTIDKTWRWESGKVQRAGEIKKDKKTPYEEALRIRHAKVSEIAAGTEDEKTRCLLQLLAGQTAGVRMVEIEGVFQEIFSQSELIEFIERINEKILNPADAKIHIRNDIAIIGPQNPHWGNDAGEPILIDRVAAIAQLVKSRQEETAKKMKLALHGEAAKLEAIEGGNAGLKKALAKATRDIEEALRRATEATAEKDAALALASPDVIAEKVAKATAEIRKACADEREAAQKEVKAAKTEAQREVAVARAGAQTEVASAKEEAKQAKARQAAAEAALKAKQAPMEEKIAAAVAAAQPEIQKLTGLVAELRRSLANEIRLRRKAEQDASQAESARRELRRDLDGWILRRH